MTIKQVITDLQKSGYNVSFYKRKDGGIRITRINGETFRGSSGNKKARSIIGVDLSELQSRALSKLKTPKGKGSYNKRRKAVLDEYTRERIKKLQKEYRKAEKKEGKPTIRNYRYVMKHYGKEEADRLLGQAQRRIEGLAYIELVDTLIVRIEADLKKKKSPSMSQALQKIKDNKESFKFVWVWPIFDILYDWELGLKGEEAGEEIQAIIK